MVVEDELMHTAPPWRLTASQLPREGKFATVLLTNPWQSHLTSESVLFVELARINDECFSFWQGLLVDPVEISFAFTSSHGDGASIGTAPRLL